MKVADLNAKGGVLGEQIELDHGRRLLRRRAGGRRRELAGAAGVGGLRPPVFRRRHSGVEDLCGGRHSDDFPYSTNPTLTEQGFANVFRVCGRDDDPGHPGDLPGRALGRPSPSPSSTTARRTARASPEEAHDAAQRARHHREYLFEAIEAGQAGLLGRRRTSCGPMGDRCALLRRLYRTRRRLIIRQARRRRLRSGDWSAGDAHHQRGLLARRRAGGGGRAVRSYADPAHQHEAAAIVGAIPRGRV